MKASFTPPLSAMFSPNVKEPFTYTYRKCKSNIILRFQTKRIGCDKNLHVTVLSKYFIEELYCIDVTLFTAYIPVAPFTNMV